MSAGVVTGTANNVTIGGAQVLFDTVDIGYTNGDIEATRETVVKELKDGLPLSVVLQVPIEEKWQLKIPMVESTIANIARASSNIVATSTAATPVTVSAFQAFTFAAWPVGALQAFQVLNGTVTAINLSTVIVKDSTETTTYTVNTDYLIDAARGVIYRNPTGGISSAATVHITYHYTPAAYDELLLGVNASIVNKKVEFIHVSPVSGNVHHSCYWRCQGKGNLNLSHKKEDFLTFDAELIAMPDPVNHPTCPTGFRRLITAANAAAYLATITVT